MKDIKAILVLALCIAVTFLGLYVQFFAGTGRDSKEHEDRQRGNQNWQEEAITQAGIVKNGQRKETPATEEELTPERFGLSYGWSVYFTGMETIQEDDTFLPYQAYADLVPATMEFLVGQTELELPENTDLELRLNESMAYREGNQIGFHCYFADLETDLEVEYIYDDIQMKYAEIHLTEKGVWRFKWKK